MRQLTVMENIFLGAELGRFGMVDDETMTLRCQQLLERVKLKVSPATKVGELGLGQQLVEIARALNKQVRLLILDEPTSSLTEQKPRCCLGLSLTCASTVLPASTSPTSLMRSKQFRTPSVIRDGQHIATRPAAG